MIVKENQSCGVSVMGVIQTMLWVSVFRVSCWAHSGWLHCPLNSSLLWPLVPTTGCRHLRLIYHI